MPSPLNPRLARLLRGLASVQARLDELETELVEYLREEDVTLEDIGEAYDPPKSRQGLTSWLKTRRARREAAP